MRARADRRRQRSSRAVAATSGLLGGAGVCDASGHFAARAAGVLDPAALGCALLALVVLAGCLVALSAQSAARTVGDARALVAAWRGRSR